MIHIIHQAIEEGILPNDEGHTQGIAFFDEESSSSGSNNLVNMNPATAELFILAKEGDINNMRSYLFDLTQPQTAAAEQIDYDDLVEFAGTPLIYACENGNLPMVRLLIQEGASLLMLSENGYYPYLASCLYGGRDEITAFLLMLAGVDEDCKDHLEQNALMIALLSERYELVRKLCLWPGVNINAQDYYAQEGSSLLMLAIHTSALDVVYLLLSHPSILVNLTDQDGNDSLILATRLGQIDIVEALLRVEDLNINHQNHEGMTGFMYACQEGNEEILRAFRLHDIEHKRTVLWQLRNQSGLTALNLATIEGHERIVSELLNVNSHQPA